MSRPKGYGTIPQWDRDDYGQPPAPYNTVPEYWPPDTYQRCDDEQQTGYYGQPYHPGPQQPPFNPALAQYTPLPQEQDLNVQQPPFNPAVAQYTPLPQEQDLNVQQPPFNPAAHYTPVLQQQNLNVVVTNQPQVQTVIHAFPTANTYFVMTLVNMVICFLFGNLSAFICLIPALISAIVAGDHNKAGNYNSARKCGQFALCCNILSFVWFIVALVAVVTVLVLMFVVGYPIGQL